jgi:large-conductance mechanosensitive channel
MQASTIIIGVVLFMIIALTMSGVIYALEETNERNKEYEKENKNNDNDKYTNNGNSN